MTAAIQSIKDWAVRPCIAVAGIDKAPESFCNLVEFHKLSLDLLKTPGRKVADLAAVAATIAPQIEELPDVIEGEA